jgi:phosphoglucosamine mutase
VFISEEMKRRKAGFGGEPSGTYVFPEVSYAPDGIFAAIYLCSIVSKSGPLSVLLEEIPHYPMWRKGISYKGNRETIRNAIRKAARATSCKKIDETDGYRMEFDDGWALVRLSGTEPKVRIMVEGIDEHAADRLLALSEKLVSGSMKGVRA